MFVFKSTFKSFRQYVTLSIKSITAQINYQTNSLEKYTDAVMEKSLKLENRVGNLEGTLFENNHESRIQYLEDLVKELQRKSN